MPAKANAQPALEDIAEASHARFDHALDEFKGRAQNVAHDTLESLRTHTKPYVENAGEHVAPAEKYIVERVQKQPLTSTLAVLGVGVLLGFILSGGRSR